MNEVSRKTLELFIEKTDELAEYVSKYNYGGLMGIFRHTGEEWQIHPAIRGFLITFRMFIQPRDGIALYPPKGRSQLLILAGVSDGWREKVEHACKQIADVLAIAPQKLIYNGKPITRWEVIETFLYGNIAHTNKREREIFNQWKQDVALFENLQFEFVSTLGFMFGEILAVAEASRHELKR